MIFSVARCPHCNILQTIQINDIKKAALRCVHCHKQTKIHKADGTTIELHGFFENARDAIAVCQKLKEKPIHEFQPATNWKK